MAGDELVGDEEQYRARYERTLRLASALAELTPLAASSSGAAVADIDAALRTLLSRATDVLEVALGGVWRYDPREDHIIAHAFYDRAIRGWTAGQIVAGATAPEYLRALHAAEAVPASDAHTDPRTSELTASYLVPHDIGALLDARMMVRGAFGGVVCFEHVGATRRWAQEEIRFAIGVAGLAAALLERHDAASALPTTHEAQLQLQIDELRREATEQGAFLRHITDNIREAFWIASWPERTFLYATPSIEQLSGRSLTDITAAGRQLRDLVHPADIGELARQVADGRERFDLVHRALRPDGSVRWIETHAFFIFDADHKPIRLAGVSADVTERTEAAAARAEAEARIAQLLERDGDPARSRHGTGPVRFGEGNRLGGLLGSSAPMREVFRKIHQAAEADITVLIVGESGTGKELAAAAIHELGARRGKPFVALNCAAIPEALLESELFGYVKGAFTGATRDKVGLMQAAHGGTLFLDEIGDMPLALQVKLLRALQQREIRRLGDERAVPIDIRLISATHRDLRAAVASGHVREDFFYRIRVFEIVMPPLRARPDDIPLLASHFATELGRLAHRSTLMISQDAMKRLTEYDFPGNVRELRNAIERAIVGAERGTIQVDDLPPEMRGDATDEVVIAPPDMKTAIEDALRTSGGNRTEAARLLGISRVTLWKRMRRLGLATDDP